MSVATQNGSAAPVRVCPRPALVGAAVLLGSFLVGFDTRLLAISLPDLRGAFGLSYDQGAWLSTVATAPQILIAPAVAWLAATFGVRRVLFGPSLVYAAVSFAIPQVADWRLLLVLHGLRGLLLGVFIPATIMIVFRNLPLRWWVPAFAIYAFRLAFSQSAGIAIVGFYETRLGWQWVYWQDIVLAPAIGVLVSLGAPRETTDRGLLERADWGGMALLGTGSAAIYVALDQGDRLDWAQSGLVITLLAAGAALLAGFFLNEARVRHPWASHRVVATRNILLAFVLILCFDVASVSGSFLVPGFLAAVAQLRPEQIGGPVFAGAALPLVVLMPLAVVAVRRFDARLSMLAGFAAFAVAGRMGAQVTHEWTAADFLPVMLVQSVGQAFTFLAAVIYILANSDPKMATATAAYVQVLRLGGAETTLSLMTTFLRHREQLHSYLIGLHVSAASPAAGAAIGALSARFAGADPSSALAGARGVAGLAALVAREARVMAYSDAFLASFWGALAGLVILALMGPAPAGPLAPR
ncbi:MFS transporter [Pseudoxanthobacter sp.]|uniref:MFS transporter n=1 Tax=Pseudoxanthobacter sp. TaxID=1925742 RepID=UPI002FE340E4